MFFRVSFPNAKHGRAEQKFPPCLLEDEKAIWEFVLDLFINARIDNMARSGSRKSDLSGSGSALKSSETTNSKEKRWMMTHNFRGEKIKKPQKVICKYTQEKHMGETRLMGIQALKPVLVAPCDGEKNEIPLYSARSKKTPQKQGSIMLVDGTSQMQ